MIKFNGQLGKSKPADVAITLNTYTLISFDADT